MVIINPIVISLRELKDKLRGELLDNMLRSFCCEREPFIENFVRNKVLHSEEMGTSKSFFIVDQDRSDSKNICVLAYYCLALKVMCINKEITDKDVKKLRLKDKKQKHIPTYYIAQLAKNDTYKKEIEGKDILVSAFNTILTAVKIVGGRIIWVEAKKEKENVMKFYFKNDFIELQTEEQDDGTYSHLIRTINC